MMALPAPVTAHAPSQASAAIIATDIPARLDRLRWGRFHTLVVVALGITWILDGLEVTLAGAVSPALKESPQLKFSNADVGLASSAYLAGAVLGALFFGWLTDRLGRKRLFFITLAVYLVATAATALSWNLASFALFRFFTGAGIGGEYTAINSTIQELVPARYRGWTDLVINGSFWIGTALGAAGSIVLLNPNVLPPDWGWRLAFLIGAVLGLVIFLMRLWLPESPRWLMTHGRVEEATAVLDRIEAEFRARGHRLADEPLPVIRLRVRRSTPLAEVAHTLFRVERRRTLVSLCHRRLVGDWPDRGLDGDLLLRLGGGELVISHGERNLSARSARPRHRLLLCRRNRHRRRGRTVVVRRADRYRLALEPLRRLPRRLVADARGGVDRGALRRRRRTQIAGKHQPAARRRRLRTANPGPGVRHFGGRGLDIPLNHLCQGSAIIGRPCQACPPTPLHPAAAHALL
jgi:Sugar (and other) transporter